MRECSPPKTSHMSCVTCHVSRVTCHVSHGTCHIAHVTCHFFSSSFFEQSGEAYWCRVCYQWGLPRLVCDCAELAETAWHGATPVIIHLYELSHQTIMLCYQARD